MRGLRLPVHYHGPAPAVRGGNHGALHAQDHRGDVRGGPAAPEVDGAETLVGERRKVDDRGADEPGPEGSDGSVCD